MVAEIRSHTVEFVRQWVAMLALAVVSLQLAAPAQPPAILQIFREPLRPGVQAEYDRIEADTARKCAELDCPHPYLGLESLTGPKETWWFNAYASAAEQKEVAAAWAKSTRALEVLGRNSTRKAPLIGKGLERFARHRPDWSTGTPWLMGRGRFLVIRMAKGGEGMTGTAFEMDDGMRLVIVPARTRDEADALAARAEGRVFAVRPSWSHPAADWIAADPEFWRRS